MEAFPKSVEFLMPLSSHLFHLAWVTYLQNAPVYWQPAFY